MPYMHDAIPSLGDELGAVIAAVVVVRNSPCTLSIKMHYLCTDAASMNESGDNEYL